MSFWPISLEKRSPTNIQIQSFVFFFIFNNLVIAALSISHYSITVNVHHICKKKLTPTFTGYFVLFILCIIEYNSYPISKQLMTALVLLAIINYFTFVNNILSIMRSTLHIDVFGTHFKKE